MNGRNLGDAPPWLFWAVTGVVAMVLHFGFRQNVFVAVGIGVLAAVAAVALVVEVSYRRRR